MTATKEIKRGDKLTLKFKNGAINQEGITTIISKSPCGRNALLHFDCPTSKQVVAGSVWECLVEFTFQKKIVVKPITLISEPEKTETDTGETA